MKKIIKLKIKNSIKTLLLVIKTLIIECELVFKKNELTLQIFLERGDNPHHLFSFNLEKWPDGENIIWLCFFDKWIIGAPTI